MPYSYPEIRAFRGLHKQANSFNVPDGALEEAKNCVVVKDDLISKRRGFYEYLDSGADTLVNLAEFNETLIAIFADKIASVVDTGTAPNETGSRTNLTGQSFDITSPIDGNFAESNKNFYFTTDDGVMKIESTTSDVFQAGTPPGLDIEPELFDDSTGFEFLATGRDTAYRVVFGRRDGNDNLLLSAPSQIISISNASGSNKGVRLYISIPSQITSGDGFFYQVYRTDSVLTGAVPDIATLKLVSEVELSAAEITLGVAVFEDVLIEDAQLGAILYTNPNTAEGELQANTRPPKCTDMVLFKNHLFYSQVTTRHFLSFDLVKDPGVTGTITNGDKIVVKVGAVERTYVANDGDGNRTLTATPTLSAGDLVVPSTTHTFAVGDTVKIVRLNDITGISEGDFTVSAITAGVDFTLDTNTAVLGASPTVTYEGFRNTSAEGYFYLEDAIAITTNLRETAQGLVKAINRDPSSLVYAQYTSGLTGAPGKMRLEAKGFTGVISIRASSASAGGSFTPTLPTSFGSGAQVESANDDQPNIFFVSKISEPEAVPIVNFFEVGARNKKIIRIAALRDSVIVMKEDGVFRVTGDSVASFSVTALDSTVEIVASKSVDVINNQVALLTNQGVCLVTESSVEIISRSIEDIIQPTLTLTTLETTVSGVAYESERLYLISMPTPDGGSTTTYAYNVLNSSWTEWDQTFTNGGVAQTDFLFLIADDKIEKERKKHTKLDYTGQNHSITVSSVAADGLSAVITGSTTPLENWVIVKSDLISRITSVSGTSSPFTVTFQLPTNLEAADTPIMYESFDSEVKLAPYHGGIVQRFKQFAQFQLHVRGDSFGGADVRFADSRSETSTSITWSGPAVSLGTGWGLEPWGLFPWGNAEGINLRFGTRTNDVLRVYVPQSHQRSTFIQPIVIHKRAAEQMNIQAMSFALRAWGERVTV